MTSTKWCNGSSLVITSATPSASEMIKGWTFLTCSHFSNNCHYVDSHYSYWFKWNAFVRFSSHNISCGVSLVRCSSTHVGLLCACVSCRVKGWGAHISTAFYSPGVTQGLWIPAESSMRQQIQTLCPSYPNIQLQSDLFKDYGMKIEKRQALPNFPVL